MRNLLPFNPMLLHTNFSLRSPQMWFTLLLTLFLGSTSLRAQVQVEQHADTTAILIGEQIRLRLTCTLPQSQRAAFPAPQPGDTLIKGVEFLSTTPTDTVKEKNSGMMKLTKYYFINSFDSALYVLPPLPVEVNGKKYFAKKNIGLKVSTVPVDTVHVDRFPGPHDVADAPFSWTWRIPAKMGLTWLLFFCFLACVIRLTNPRMWVKKVVIYPPLPPHVQALNAFQALRGEVVSDVKAFYMKLTDALRTYLQDRLAVTAHEKTTAEICEELQALPQIKSVEEVKEILTTADLAKFAKLKVTDTVMQHNLEQAEHFVAETKPEVEPDLRPRVEFRTLSEKRQSQIRLALRIASVLLLVGSLTAAAFTWIDVWECFL